MANLKKALLLGVLAATAAAGLAGFFLLDGSATRLAVDGALAFVLVIVVFAMMSPTEKRVDLLIEALRALARGERHQRVNPDEFAGLSEVARAMNEVAASLTENEDPNLGPVRAIPRKREAPVPVRPTAQPTARVAAAEPAGVAPSIDLDDPSVGPVRKRKRAETTTSSTSKPPSGTSPAGSSASPDAPPATPAGAPAQAAASPAIAPTSSASSAAASESPARSGAPDISRPESAAAGNDTAVDEGGRPAGASAEPSGEADAGASVENPTLPTRAELEALFNDFVAQKKAHGESVADLDLEAFAQTILGECSRLVAAHECRGVKFEITEQDGEVSLRPRLLR